MQLNEDRVLLASLTRACKLENDVLRTRLPIKRKLLEIILKQTQLHFLNKGQPYLAVLYTTLLAIAYFGMFRVGELATGDHPVMVKDVQIADNKDKVMFILRSSKTHGKYAKPQVIKIKSEGYSRPQQWFCPYKLLRRYIKHRPCSDFRHEAFFVFSDNSPVTPAQVWTILKTLLTEKGYDPRLYGTHSLRAGRSIELLDCGVPLEFICKFGRWQSNVIYSYLKQ